MNHSPGISVIVPTYNCVDFIQQCIDSLLKQTFDDYEIIIVDDGSTDGTDAIAKQYAANHSIISFFSQQHQYAGAARNLGIDRSKGKYLLFLDGDDYFDTNLLLHTYNRIEETEADVCVFGAGYLNNETGDITYTRSSFNVSICPSTPTFNRISNPRYIFNFTTPAPWTKLFRKSYIVDNNIRFQNTRSANDIRFVFTAIAAARRITVLDEFLVIYRQQNNSSLQATQHKDPMAFYNALISLQSELESRGLMTPIRKAFDNVALVNCVYNLHSLEKHPLIQQGLFDFLQTQGLSELGIADKPRSWFYMHSTSRLNDFEVIQRGTFEQFKHRSKNQTSSHNQTKGKPMNSSDSAFRKTIRSIIPLRASVFEKSKKQLLSEIKSINKELERLREENNNLSDKLSALIMEIQENKDRSI